MRKKKIIILTLLSIITLAVIVPMIINPMRMPRSVIRHQVLRITPLGTSIEDVIEIIENRDDWGSPSVSFEFGFAPLSPGRRAPLPEHLGFSDLPRVGEMSVSSHIGSYFNLFLPLITDVTLFWGFDEDGKLIDVHVWKISGG